MILFTISCDCYKNCEDLWGHNSLGFPVSLVQIEIHTNQVGSYFYHSQAPVWASLKSEQTAVCDSPQSSISDRTVWALFTEIARTCQRGSAGRKAHSETRGNEWRRQRQWKLSSRESYQGCIELFNSLIFIVICKKSCKSYFLHRVVTCRLSDIEISWSFATACW